MIDVEQHSNDSNGDDSVEADRHNESILHFCVQFDEVLQCMKRTNEIDADIPKDILKRKEARYKRLIEYRRLKRKDERRRRRQRKANVDVECFRLDFELNVIVDLAFTDAMNGKELGKLVRQMGRVWGIQKRYIGLKTTLLSPCKKFLEESRRVLTGFDSFQWNISFSDVQAGIPNLPALLVIISFVLRIQSRKTSFDIL
ncbi:hypothetical protein Tcan_04294 [Toxocara canis]|uniref:Uncharacterized protein n=1 Tax=Toxocara canis TaxID=6265 RepID=A0A0B2VMP5_TOXCA|nr:hypothetical protein Tcan_04294 [Toxocara canis]